MPISSFYGMQTSLRGLIAQQRMLDTTGHNIANASTQGYSRQEATLAASQALQMQASGSATATGAHLGSGVDVQGFRRIRDQFLDVQFRSQSTKLSEWKAKAEALDTAELALAEPSDNGVNAQLVKFWKAWSDLSNAPSDGSAKQVLAEQAGALTDAIGSVRAQLVSAQQNAEDQYDSITRAGGDIELIAKDLADLNTTISAFVTNGDAPNDLMDRRDLLLDKLSTFGQISVEQLPGGSQNVSFVNGAVSIVEDKAAAWNAPPPAVWTPPPPPGTWKPGGQLGGLLEAGKAPDPDNTIGEYVRMLDSFSEALADKVNSAPAVVVPGSPDSPFFTFDPAADSPLQVLSTIRDDPSTIVSGTVSPNDLALAIARLQDDPSIGGAYKTFVAKVGSNLNESMRMQANAQVLADSVEDRRQSVAGVSMDEEMSNLVRFQRAYQASARAMSTMDEMLDVLINRTGRVGL